MSLPVPTTTTTAIGGGQYSATMSELNRMDAPLIALTNQCRGDLRQLLYAFFSFLNRRTDFYFVHHSSPSSTTASGVTTASMGFAEGDAEKLLLAAFRQFPLRRIPKGADDRKQQQQREHSSKSASTATAKSTTGTTFTSSHFDKNNNSSDVPLTSLNAGTMNNVSNTNASINSESDNGISIPPNMKGIRYNEDGVQIPIGNGGSTPEYKWTQTLEETTILIGVPKSFRGKDFDVKITSSELSVKAKKVIPGEKMERTFVDGTLTEKVRTDESTWSVENGVLMVTMDKLRKTFWKTVLVGDEEIDTDMVDSSTHISDYDDATQGQIRKIIFDQNQYHLDKPSSDEILGKKKTTPYLPPGVEYIDQKTIDDANYSNRGKNTKE